MSIDIPKKGRLHKNHFEPIESCDSSLGGPSGDSLAKCLADRHSEETYTEGRACCPHHNPTTGYSISHLPLLHKLHLELPSYRSIVCLTSPQLINYTCGTSHYHGLVILGDICFIPKHMKVEASPKSSCNHGGPYDTL